MKKTLLGALALLAALSTAQAATINGFTGAFAHTNWTLDPAGGALSAGPASVSMSTINDGVNNGIGDRLDYSIVITTAGTISFDWAFVTGDDPFYEAAGFLNDGDFNRLSNEVDSVQDGSGEVWVDAGDVFGFSVWSIDGNFDPSTTRFSNFSFTDGSTIPEPPALALAALLIAGLAAGRRQRSRR